MDFEIERKFLVDLNLLPDLSSFDFDEIVQGYVSKNSNLTVRIRIKNKEAYLTFKGKTIGISRTELETKVDLEFAEKLILNFNLELIRKKRFYIPFENNIFELDVFEGKLDGLILAEVELSSEDELIRLPNWISREVSDDPQYYNVNLINKQ